MGGTIDYLVGTMFVGSEKWKKATRGHGGGGGSSDADADNKVAGMVGGARQDTNKKKGKKQQ